jgi:hypothetical protein
MRKTLALLLMAALVMAVFVGPGSARSKRKKAKPKKIEKTVSLTALPLPNYSSHTGTTSPGCTAGEEGVHKVTTALHVPGKGKLTADLSGFDGDWDLYVFDDAKNVIVGRSENVQVPDGAAQEENVTVVLKKMADLSIVACNWAGGPQAELHYKALFIPAKGGHSHH